MKKTAGGLLVVAAFAIALTGCTFNLFGALDKLKVPDATDLMNMAKGNAADFVSKVQDYLDSGSVTEDNAGDIVTALEDVYTSTPGTETGQKAAVLAGEISITAHPETKGVVDGVIGTVMDAINTNSDVDPETLIQNIFPPDLTQAGLTKILDNLTTAANAYNSFGNNTTGAKEWMSGGEIGDVAQYAAVSMGVADIRAQLIVSEGSEAAADSVLFSVVTGGTLPSVTNPFDENASTTYGGSLANILNLAGLSI